MSFFVIYFSFIYSKYILISCNKWLITMLSKVKCQKLPYFLGLNLWLHHWSLCIIIKKVFMWRKKWDKEFVLVAFQSVNHNLCFLPSIINYAATSGSAYKLVVIYVIGSWKSASSVVITFSLLSSLWKTKNNRPDLRKSSLTLVLLVLYAINRCELIIADNRDFQEIINQQSSAWSE